mmetsp:Transcript_89565/g.227826  ORF Transcript_89565/g.227826 Transcript_89565/m.227826 type:complete len:339 (+) Transcript_89565:134-1150(+)
MQTAQSPESQHIGVVEVVALLRRRRRLRSTVLLIDLLHLFLPLCLLLAASPDRGFTHRRIFPLRPTRSALVGGPAAVVLLQHLCAMNPALELRRQRHIVAHGPLLVGPAVAVANGGLLLGALPELVDHVLLGLALEAGPIGGPAAPPLLPAPLVSALRAAVGFAFQDYLPEMHVDVTAFVDTHADLSSRGGPAQQLLRQAGNPPAFDDYLDGHVGDGLAPENLAIRLHALPILWQRRELLLQHLLNLHWYSRQGRVEVLVPDKQPFHVLADGRRDLLSGIRVSQLLVVEQVIFELAPQVGRIRHEAEIDKSYTADHGVGGVVQDGTDLAKILRLGQRE